MSGLSEKQKEFVAALALWKIDRLLKTPFRYRSGCHLELISLKHGEQDVELDVDIKDAINNAVFRAEDRSGADRHRHLLAARRALSRRQVMTISRVLPVTTTMVPSDGDGEDA